jgi:energy-coupling factor transporter ATP-binding protein EcfA2
MRQLRSADHLHRRISPWWWPLALNSAELVGLLGWPIGDSDFPGVPGLHPRLLPPSDQLSTRPDRVVATSTAPGHTQAIGLDTGGALRHTWVLGPNGTGKSTLLASLALQDITAGRGVVIIEPKGDLVHDILARVPVERADDIVVLDPTDNTPVGLNPLSGQGREDTRVEGLVSVFRALYADSWGPRTQDIVHSSLLTLARRGDASLAMVPLLLTNTGFRRSVVRRVASADPVALGPFWAWYDALSNAERATVIAPIMNKLRPFLLNPGLRAMVGQRRPRITVSQILTQNKVLLVPLRKQVIGAEAARLTGSLVVAELWQAIQGRLSLSTGARHPVMVYIDEVQDYLHLPTDLADALAQARGLGAGFTVAHQYASQLPTAMRAGFVGNIRSRVAFQLAHDDATLLAKGHPEVTADDFTALPAFHVYASLATGSGQVTPYASGRTSVLPAATADPDALRRNSQARYGAALDAVERELAELVEVETASTSETTGGSGRKRRTS